MSLDPATVRRIAKLARIGVDEADVPRLQGELNAILGWIEQLLEADVDQVEPLAGGVHEVHTYEQGNLQDSSFAYLNDEVPPIQKTLGRPLRQDVVGDGNIAEAILSNAPDRVGAFFTVPKVVE